MELLAEALKMAAGLIGVLQALIEFENSKRKRKETQTEARRPRHLRK